jgi:hypothetical protein
MAKTTKTKLVLHHLRGGNSITSLEAINLFSATRLSAIIFKLKARGHNITTTSVTIKDRFGNSCQYAKYRLLDVELVKADNPLSQQDLFTDTVEEKHSKIDKKEAMLELIKEVRERFPIEQPKQKKSNNNKTFFQKLWSKIISAE